MESGTFINMDNKKRDNHGEEKRPKSVTFYCWLKTVLLVITYVGSGISYSIQYTTIPDMRVRMNTTTEGLSYAMAVGALGGIVGGPMSGLADKFSDHSDLVIATAVGSSAVAFTAFPFSPNLWALGIFDFIFTSGWALYQGAAHASVSSIWGLEGGAVRHAIHFGFPVGSILGPLIALPFLSEANTTGEDTVDADVLDEDCLSHKEGRCSIIHRKEILTEGTDTSSIEVAYVIAGILLMCACFIFILMHCFRPHNATLIPSHLHIVHTERSWREVISPRTWAEGDLRFGTTIMVLIMGYYFLVLATIKGTQEYIVPYAVDSGLGFSNQEAATLNSVISGMGTLARGLSVIAVKFLDMTHILIIESHGLFIFGLLALIWGTKYKIALWVFVPCLGFFRESLWPSGYAWVDNFIILYGVLVGLIDVMVGLTNFGLVSLQGYLYTNTVIESIFYTTVSYGLVLCILVHVMNFLGNRHGNRKVVSLKREISVQDSTYL